VLPHWHPVARQWRSSPRTASATSYIQRKLSVGYNKAAKLVELMEEAGVVSQANHVGKREVLVPEQ
jgi:DNA segregation ATPase FtsK/SpoIIIE-like protein